MNIQRSVEDSIIVLASFPPNRRNLDTVSSPIRSATRSTTPKKPASTNQTCDDSIIIIDDDENTPVKNCLNGTIVLDSDDDETSKTSSLLSDVQTGSTTTQATSNIRSRTCNLPQPAPDKAKRPTEFVRPATKSKAPQVRVPPSQSMAAPSVDSRTCSRDAFLGLRWRQVLGGCSLAPSSTFPGGQWVQGNSKPVAAVVASPSADSNNSGMSSLTIGSTKLRSTSSTSSKRLDKHNVAVPKGTKRASPLKAAATTASASNNSARRETVSDSVKVKNAIVARNSRDVPMEVEETKTNQPGRGQQRVVKGKGGSLTATLNCNSGPSSKHSPLAAVTPKKGVVRKSRRSSLIDEAKDSFRHFIGISKNSKTWPKKKKNTTKKKKKALQKLSEAAINKVVLGIRNLSSEHNVGTDVIAFTSGKSPCVGKTPCSPLDQIRSNAGPARAKAQLKNKMPEHVKVPEQTISPSNVENMDHSSNNSEDVTIIGSDLPTSDKRVAMVNPSQQAGLKITLNSAAKTRAVQNIVQNVEHQQFRPFPPSPRTLLLSGRLFPNAYTTITAPLMLEPTIPLRAQQRPPVAPREQKSLNGPVTKPVLLPGSLALRSKPDDSKLRPIAIDGSNVAYSHGKNNYFSCRGIQLCVEFFRKRGHKSVKAFVPQYRRSRSYVVKNAEILEELNKDGVQTVVFTPSRKVNNTLISSYDDRMIVEYAVESGAVIVSNDNYRDIMNENVDFKAVIERRLLMYTFVDDLFMVPQDPLGRKGPPLDVFLSFSSGS